MIPLFVPGGMELAIVAGIAILIFGASKIPRLANSIGRSTGEFKKGLEQSEADLEELQAELDE